MATWVKSPYRNKQFISINSQWLEENIHAWQLIARDRLIANSPEFQRLHQKSAGYLPPEYTFPEYNAINHAKIDFINWAINHDLIRDEFVCWSDFGWHSSIGNDRNQHLIPKTTLDLHKLNLEKMNFCLAHPITAKDLDLAYTTTSNEVVFTGSFFAGPTSLMSSFQELYHEGLEELYACNVIDDDQTVYLRCFLKAPELFQLYLSNDQWPKALDYFAKNEPLSSTDLSLSQQIADYLSCREYLDRTPLCEIMTFYGSDKGNNSHHNYASLYFKLLEDKKDQVLNVFELGIGTNYTDVPSNMGIHGKPGASLYGWAKYFPNSRVFGADIDKRILFQKDNIKTYFCDQTSPESINALFSHPDLQNEMFDVIIDDGLHEFSANLTFLMHSIHKLKPGGLYIIEDLMPETQQSFKYLSCVLKSLLQVSEIELVNIPLATNRTDNALLLIRK